MLSARVNWKTSITLLWALAALTLSAVGGAATFVPLGAIENAPQSSEGLLSRANGVSDHGTVVVGMGLSGGCCMSFRWIRGGKMIGLAERDPFNEAFDVSANGRVVVGSAAFSGKVLPYRWTSEDGMVALGDPPAGEFYGTAWGVSADGSVVVGTWNGNSFRWTSDDGVVLLAPGMARDVSADGNVVVGRWFKATHLEAYRWTAEDGLVGLGPGYGDSIAWAVSADGAVVVGGAGGQAFRWTADEGMVILGGSYNSLAKGISADGSFVVGSARGRAVFWTAADEMHSLQDVLLDRGAQGLTGWTLTDATAVSADGNWVVGQGTNPSGEIEGFLANLSPLPKVTVGVTANFGEVLECDGKSDIAILGSVSFDVTQIEIGSLSYNGVLLGQKDNGTYRCDIYDVNVDGYLDLTCQILDEQTVGLLAGTLTDGTPIEGSDMSCVLRN